MSKKNIIILIIAIVFFIIALLFFISNFQINNNENEKENVIKTEEVSKTKDIENSKYKESTLYKADGSETKITDYQNQAIVLFFFNKDNVDSMEDLKKLEEMHSKYEESIKFIAINTAKEVDENIQKDYTLEIYYDFYQETVRNYNILEVPSFIYINKENEVVNAKAGFTTSDALEANLDILSENF